MLIKPIKKIKDEITIPGDKSISHRGIMLSSIAQGQSNIYNISDGDDCLNTIECFVQMGVPIDISKQNIAIHGVGLRGLKKPARTLYVGNSGTTIRLISGILAGQNFVSEITGDYSITNRPMDRIIFPLKEMGAEIYGVNKPYKAPIRIRGQNLKPIDYTLPVASAQVKSAVLFAGLYANGKTTIIENQITRDHTENMLNYMGGNVMKKGTNIFLEPMDRLYAGEIYIPGDISSAAFFIVLAILCKDGEILIRNVGLNPTRTGFLDVLTGMGANINISNKRIQSNEIIGDIYAKSSKLKGINIDGTIVPRLIDEIPIIAIAASLAEGRTIISNAEELRVKESDRIHSMVIELKSIGVDIMEKEDGMIITGKNQLQGGKVNSHGDHRIAMALCIAGLISENGTIIDDPRSVNISFPDFFDIIHRIIKRNDII